MSFGKRLKEARKKRGLTQVQAADELGIDDTTLSKYENNKSEPDNDILLRIATLYGMTSDFLLGRENMKEPTYTEMDTKLIKDFKSLNVEDQEYILKFIERLKR